jgi:hypothetical protein
MFAMGLCGSFQNRLAMGEPSIEIEGLFDDTALAANLRGPASSFLVARTANDLRLVAPALRPGPSRRRRILVQNAGAEKGDRSLSRLTPPDVYIGRAQTILSEGERIKRGTIRNRRLQHQKHAA